MLQSTSAPAVLSPRERYANDLQRADFEHDDAQAAAVEQLQRIHDHLIATPPRWYRRHWRHVPGLYLWGGVGRGKTYLMDCFYQSLPFSHKRRAHFHHFMALVHERRRAHTKTRDPLRHVAAELAHERVLCFDEFFVSDVADAMILGRLTRFLFAHGVTLVATSNIAPDQLYADGLQRRRFLPAIERLKKHCHVLHVDNGTDYRTQLLESAGLYHQPLGDAAEARMQTAFKRMAGQPATTDTAIHVNDRDIAVQAVADGIIRFSFHALCETPRSAIDYTEIARSYHTVLLAGVPVLNDDDRNAVRRLIAAIDEFYDRGVKLVVSAAAPPDALYTGKRLAFEFERTTSRLHEMGSHSYLMSEHRP